MLTALARSYFEAAYDMDAERFASLFHPASSVSRVGDDLQVTVTPIESWLSVVRNATAPSRASLPRHDELLSIDIMGPLALITLRLQIPPRSFTDLLSCVRLDGAWRILQKVTNVHSAN